MTLIIRGIIFVVQVAKMIFGETHGNAIRQIAPRLEPLETPIEDPKKTKHIVSDYVYSDGTRHTWTTTEINFKLDNAEQ